MDIRLKNNIRTYLEILFNKAHYVFLVIAIVFGIFTSLYSKPFDIPDEDAHWLKAYSVATFQFSAIDGVNTYLPNNVTHFIDGVTEAGYQNIEDISSLKDMKDFQGGYDFTAFRTAGVNPLLQLAPAVGIFVASIFTDTLIYQFIGGRIMNLLAYTLIIFFAIKRSPKHKWAMTTIGLFPMSILLAASYSYDALIIAFAILLFSSFCSMHYKEEKASKLDIGLYVISGAFVVMAKMVYAPMVGLILLIDKNKFKHLYDKYIIMVGSALLGVVVYYTWTKFGYLLTYLFNGNLIDRYRLQLESTSQLATPTGISIVSDVKDFIMRPTFYIRSFFATMGYYGKMYIPATIGISFGLSTPYNISLLVWILFISISIFEFDNEKFQWFNWLYRFGLFLACVFLIFLALYSYIPPADANQLTTEFIRGAGIQGRYFLPCALLLIMNIPIKFMDRYYKQWITLGLFIIFVGQSAGILLKLM